MKRWHKIALILLGLVTLSQIPFAYRRYQLGRLHAAIQSLESQHQQSASDGVIEYRGVVHVHSFLGGHSSGTFEEIIAGARSNHLDFVVMTEHTAPDLNTADLTLKGIHNGVLFVNGNEVKTRSGDRLLLVPGDQLASKDSDWNTSEVLKRRESGLEFVAYPEDFTSWEASGLTGVEVYNVFTNTRTINPVLMFFDTAWSFSSYPDLLFATFYERPAESLRRWDDAILKKGERLVAIAGNDAHANVGFGLQDESLLRVRLDPYERSFRLVRVHVLVEPAGDSTATGQINPDHANSGQLNQQALLGAIAEGHCFIGFDLFGDTTGFRFTAQDANDRKIMGDEITLDGEVRLTAIVPVTARVLLFKDGVVIKDDWGVRSLEFVAKEKGSYRVEVYLPQLPGRVKDQPWIISNPIYVR